MQSQCAEVPSPQMNKTSALKKKKKILPHLCFWRKLLMLAAGFPLAMVTFQDACSSRNLDKLIKRLSHFKIIPKSSSN